ncbi:pre-16S rRNA-processing nuclease YqgF [Candidatus Microgenomates bacterium]|nr:pre-16S rRNA-processing nuclease YqgF [Candidatus Microgenomates bacterium]
MIILGVDYGRRKIGLAISEGKLSQPFKVVKVKSFSHAVEKIIAIQKELKVERTIVGVSEGEMGEESTKFAGEIGAVTSTESLSTHDAQELSIAAGMSRKKRKVMEDAFAASVMLQNYLDEL